MKREVYEIKIYMTDKDIKEWKEINKFLEENFYDENPEVTKEWLKMSAKQEKIAMWVAMGGINKWIEENEK